jgi:hypothetical protein
MTDEDLRRLFEGAVSEMRRHFDVSTEDVKREVRIVAEGLTRLDQKLDRTAVDIRGEMRSGFADTQAMIKFSHAELDRRLRSLEESVTDLQSRVERLESSTH